ncbi:MAG: Modification methylase DpnIIB [bacterium ADurb.Bin400]|nr:MAG: Modification methylase DpnIIB [bacterium ADurb.Bin400]
MVELGGFELGRVHCCDCLEALKQLPDKCVDLVLTDPPYGEVNRPSGGLRLLDKGIADVILYSEDEFIGQIIRVANKSIYVFCGTEQVSLVRSLMARSGLSTRLCIWEKTNPSPMNGQYMWLSSLECCVYGRQPKATFNEHCASAVWRCASENNQIHPTQKPLALFARLVLASTDIGDLVIDPFAGSGTTGVAAVQLGRQFLGFEIDPEYCRLANDRIEAARKGLKLNEYRAGQQTLFQ